MTAFDFTGQTASVTGAASVIGSNAAVRWPCSDGASLMNSQAVVPDGEYSSG